MASIPGGVRFTGFVAPSDSTDTYAVIDPIYGKGGYREVADVTERDAITTARRRLGMMVYVQGTDKFYYLKTGLTNSDWVEFASGGVSGTVNVDHGGTGLTSVVTGRLLFGNDSTTLSTSSSLSWDNTKSQLLLPNLVLTSHTLDAITAGNLEYDGSNLYFSPTALTRYSVLLDTLTEGQNLVLGTVTGTQIGTAVTQKLGFFGATPITQRGTYTTSNVTPLRTMNALDCTFDDLANIVATIVGDLKLLGLFG